MRWKILFQNEFQKSCFLEIGGVKIPLWYGRDEEDHFDFSLTAQP